MSNPAFNRSISTAGKLILSVWNANLSSVGAAAVDYLTLLSTTIKYGERDSEGQPPFGPQGSWKLWQWSFYTNICAHIGMLFWQSKTSDEGQQIIHLDASVCWEALLDTLDFCFTIQQIPLDSQNKHFPPCFVAIFLQRVFKLHHFG